MLESKKIIVTGGGGFLGKWVVKKLIGRGVSKENIFVPRSKEYDLTKEEDIKKMFGEFKADAVIHLATTPGGIGYYKEHPGEVFYKNLAMGTQLLEISRQNKVEKVIIAGSALAYPENAEIPYKEEDLWKGYPQEVEASYGIPNKILNAQSKAYRKEYGFNSIYLILANLYGPGDHFESNAHVIPSLIKKFYGAKQKNSPEVSLWGSGKAMREFLYVEDAANAVITAAEEYNSSEPLNIGSGMEISIKELAEKIAGIISYTGKIVWDTTKPEGRLRRCLDSTRAREVLKLREFTDFDKGLKKTIDWYLENVC